MFVRMAGVVGFTNPEAPFVGSGMEFQFLMSGAARRHGAAKQKQRRRRLQRAGLGLGVWDWDWEGDDAALFVGHGEFGREDDRSARRTLFENREPSSVRNTSSSLGLTAGAGPYLSEAFIKRRKNGGANYPQVTVA